MNRILLLMAHSENRRLLQNVLADEYETVVADDPSDLASAFDLGIVDAVALDRHRQHVQARTEAEAPLFLPILLVTSRRDVGMATQRLWEVVDDLLLAPVETVELHARVKTLLRSRMYSVESENRYHTLAERSPVSVCILQDEHIVYANPAFRRLCGVSEKGLAERRLLDMVHPDDTERVALYLQTLNDGPSTPAPCDARLQTADTIRWVQLHGSTITYREQPAVLSIMPDLTERIQAEQALQQSARRLENLHAIDHAILEAQSVKDIADAAIRRLQTFVPCERATVALFGRQPDEVHLVTTDAAGDFGPSVEQHLSVQDFYSAHVAPEDLQSERIRYIEDVTKMETRASTLQHIQDKGIRSLISAPLLVDGDILGELHLASTRPGAFTSEHREIAREVADQVAIAVRQARLYEEVQQRIARLDALYAVHRAATQSLNVDDVISVALDTLLDVLGVTFGAVYLLEDDSETLALQRQRGLSDRFVDRVRRLRLGEGVSGQAAAERRPVVLSRSEYSTEHLATFLQEEGFHALASTPLMAGGTLLGALTLGARHAQAFPRQEVELLEAIGQQLGQVVHNARLFDAEQRRRRELDLLYTMSRQLIATNEMETAMDDVARYAVERVHVTFCRIITREETGFVCQTAYPVRRMDRNLEAGRYEPPAATTYYRRALREDEARVLHGDSTDLTAIERKALYLDVAQSLCLVPLRVGGTAIGVLALGEQRSSEREPFDEDKLNLITAISEQVANALHRTRLYKELEESYVETVVALAEAMDARDSYTGDHSANLAELAVATAEEVECSADEIRAIRWGALLHDIGKIGVPDSILLKPGPLTDEEWEIMQRHPDIGADILVPVKKLSDVEPIVRAHQEKYDGSGYPQGLAGEAIPLGARILAVVDAYSAITDKRPYKEARSHQEAVAELERCAGSHFDPQIVAAFLRVLDGSHVGVE